MWTVTPSCGVTHDIKWNSVTNISQIHVIRKLFLKDIFWFMGGREGMEHLEGKESKVFQIIFQAYHVGRACLDTLFFFPLV